MRTRHGVWSCIRPPEPKPERFAGKALRFLAVYLVLFSIAQYVSFLVTGQEQSQLIDSTFIVLGVECGGLLLKRICDKVFGKKNNDLEE